MFQLKWHFLFTFILFVSPFESLFSKFTNAKASFYSTSGDSLKVVKDQLIYLASREIISQELRTMGFNEKAFWKEYDGTLNEKLSSSKKQMLEEIKNKSGKKEQWKERWRRKKLLIRRRFGNILQVLDSYSVGRIYRATHNRSVRMMSMQGRVNKEKLKKLYFQFQNSSSPRIVEKVYLTFELNLAQGHWKELGIDDEGDLLDSLGEYLIKEFQKTFSDRSLEIVLTDPLEFERIQKHLNMKEQKLVSLRAKENDVKGHFYNDVWMNVQLNLYVLNELTELRRKAISLGGDISVIELRYNEMVYTKQLEQVKKVIQKKKGILWGNQVGDHIFQRIAPLFIPIKSEVISLSSNIAKTSVSVIGYENYLELKELLNLFQEKGGRYQLKAHLNHFSLRNAVLILEHIGSKRHFENILTSMSGQNLKNGKIISVNRSKDPIEVVVTSFSDKMSL